MKFVPKTFVNQANNSTANVYVPESNATLAETKNPFIECDVDGIPRYLSTNVLRMMQTFNKEAEHRRALLHDCVVFALACTTGETYTRQHFEPGIKPIQIDGYNFYAPFEGASFLQEPSIDAGDVAFTVDASPLDPDFREQPHEFHFMVRATGKYDTQTGLYISKFGVMGSVALHEFPATYDYYPAVAAGLVSGMHLNDLVA
jgi:hypothetical protein